MLSARQAERYKLLITERSRRRTGTSLESFIKSSWPLIEPKNPFVNGWHVGAISEHLEAVFTGQIRNLLINIPPRHAKSTIVSVACPAWIWTKKPGHKFLYGSNSHNLSKRDSVKTRNIIQSSWYRETFNIQWELSEDQNEKMLFTNTEGGARMATSVGSSVIGSGGDWLVLDDPHSTQSAKSSVQRQSELDWIDQEFFTRVNDPKTVSKIIIMQRLDQRDVSAHVLEKGDWEHLMLPAEYEPERKCVTYIGWEDPRKNGGDVLWPDRFGEKEIGRLKKEMGSMAWAGQGQQRPAPQEGALVKRDWWKSYKEIPSDIQFKCISADLTFKDGEKNDFTVFQVWGRRQADYYLIDQVRSRMGFNQQIVTVMNILGKHQDMNAVWVEDSANGAALIDALKKKISRLIPVKPKGSKIARAEAVTPLIEAGNVHLPDPSIAPWVNDYVEEWSVFPNGAHDDQVDASTQALSQLSARQFQSFAAISLTKESTWRF